MERPTKTLVIDASVTIKWFVPEVGGDKALKLRNEHVDGSLVLQAPDLLVWEVANALRYHPEITDEQLAENLQSLIDIDIDLISPTPTLLNLTVRRARELDITSYDASYLALAELASTQLITADKELHLKAKATKRILRLDDL